MRVKGITPAVIERAVRETGLVFNRAPEVKGRWVYFTLRVQTGRDRYHRRYGLHSLSGKTRRGVSACWHGHRDFMRRLFAAHPDAVLVSAFARYDGREGFEREFPATGALNVGSQRRPVRMDQACDCYEVA